MNARASTAEEPLPQRLRARWHGLLRRVVRQRLATRAELVSPLRQEAASLRELVAAQRVGAAETRRLLRAAEEELALARMPFSADMTVDLAWRRHPRAREVFARHHLPACDGCSVRFDETLEEAARAYGLDLATLLAQLSALLQDDAGSAPRHPDGLG